MFSVCFCACPVCMLLLTFCWLSQTLKVFGVLSPLLFLLLLLFYKCFFLSFAVITFFHVGVTFVFTGSVKITVYCMTVDLSLFRSQHQFSFVFAFQCTALVLRPSLICPDSVLSHSCLHHKTFNTKSDKPTFSGPSGL